MKLTTLFVALSTIALCSCGGSGGSSNPAAEVPRVGYSDPHEPTSVSICPLTEMAGHYKAISISCSLKGAAGTNPDLGVVPSEYLVSSQGDSGQLTLVFKDSNGVKTSEAVLQFPRTTKTSDFKKHGIQCGSAPGSRSLSQNCPQGGKSCSYSILEHDGKIIGIYYRMKNEQLYACRSELVQAP
jgi:hypothetical protein